MILRHEVMSCLYKVFLCLVSSKCLSKYLYKYKKMLMSPLQAESFYLFIEK